MSYKSSTARKNSNYRREEQLRQQQQQPLDIIKNVELRSERTSPQLQVGEAKEKSLGPSVKQCGAAAGAVSYSAQYESPTVVYDEKRCGDNASANWYDEIDFGEEESETCQRRPEADPHDAKSCSVEHQNNNGHIERGHLEAEKNANRNPAVASCVASRPQEQSARQCSTSPPQQQLLLIDDDLLPPSALSLSISPAIANDLLDHDDQNDLDFAVRRPDRLQRTDGGGLEQKEQVLEGQHQEVDPQPEITPTAANVATDVRDLLREIDAVREELQTKQAGSVARGRTPVGGGDKQQQSSAPQAGHSSLSLSSIF
ncbi:unnamed protein product [Amoebophrya sp. A120]|nr:unnamed protein product [Amoebophrya sp. A120]|eukprot:GSA120T00008137001.1